MHAFHHGSNRPLKNLFLCLALALAGADDLAAQAAPVPPPAAPRARTSPHETINAVIGGRGGPRVTITYGRPYSVKPGTTEARRIWGGLVPWGKADRLGADEATVLIAQKPLTIAGQTLPAGAYTLYIIPSETGASQLAFSSHLGKWGVPVDEKNDVARFDLQKDTLSEDVPQLTLALVNDQATGGGKLLIAWETTQFSLPFTVEK